MEFPHMPHLIVIMAPLFLIIFKRTKDHFRQFCFSPPLPRWFAWLRPESQMGSRQSPVIEVNATPNIGSGSGFKKTSGSLPGSIGSRQAHPK